MITIGNGIITLSPPLKSGREAELWMKWSLNKWLLQSDTHTGAFMRLGQAWKRLKKAIKRPINHQLKKFNVRIY